MVPEKAEAPAAPKQQLAKIVPIRVETLLSQHPIHKLSKDKRPIQIKLTRENERGKIETTWKVSPNAEYGHPGELAYKLDTLVINRLIDEFHPEVPEVIQIAESLRQLSELIGKKKTGNTAEIKNALYQNAGALITARLDYVGKDKTRREFEFGSTRYGIVFIGETLPDGTKAEAIFIVLNPLFRQALKSLKRRPLDYGYLQSLPPSAQRWYELVSVQIFAALNTGNKRAKYLYSELCQRAPFVRSDDWLIVRNQMNRIHKPHIQSGYIGKVEFEKTTDKEGRLDWVMWYTPGERARFEYRRFNDRPEIEDAAPKPPPRPRLVAASRTERAPADSALVEKLMSFGIDESRAARLVGSDRAESELWANAWPHQNQKGMENPPAVLIHFIETKRRPFPAGFKKAQDAKARTTAQDAKQRVEQKRAEHEEKFLPVYRSSYLWPEIEKLRDEETAAAKALRKTLRTWEEDFAHRADAESLKAVAVGDFVVKHPELSILDFWQWDAERNPEPFKE